MVPKWDTGKHVETGVIDAVALRFRVIQLSASFFRSILLTVKRVSSLYTRKLRRLLSYFEIFKCLEAGLSR